MTLPTRILAMLCALAVSFASGWVVRARYDRAQALQHALDTSEANRETERLQARNMARISDDLTNQRLAAVRSANDLRGRLREQSASGASSPAIAACRSDGTATAARVVPPAVGDDLVALMERAEQVSDQLRACQAVIGQTATR